MNFLFENKTKGNILSYCEYYDSKIIFGNAWGNKHIQMLMNAIGGKR